MTDMINFTFSMYDLEYFLLILVRVSSFIFVAPFFSMSGTPSRIKIGLSVFTAFLLYQVLTPQEAVIYDSLMEYAVIVMKEMVTGLLIGFGANICTSIINFAGFVMDMEIGLSMVTLMDPATKESSSITGVFYQYVFMLMMIISGMYQYFLSALADSFTLIPVNKAVFDLDRLMDSMLEFMGNYIIIGFRICLPIFCVMVLLNAVLGILAKVSPQMNMFAVGIQIKILVGLTIIFVTVGMLPGAADFIFTQMKRTIVSFVEGMGAVP